MLRIAPQCDTSAVSGGGRALQADAQIATDVLRRARRGDERVAQQQVRRRRGRGAAWKRASRRQRAASSSRSLGPALVHRTHEGPIRSSRSRLPAGSAEVGGPIDRRHPSRSVSPLLIAHAWNRAGQLTGSRRSGTDVRCRLRAAARSTRSLKHRVLTSTHWASVLRLVFGSRSDVATLARDGRRPRFRRRSRRRWAASQVSR